MLFFVSLYFQNVQHLDAVQGGVRLLPLIGVFSLTSPYAGRVTTRFGAAVPITVGLTLCTAALLSLLTVSVHSPFWTLCPGLVGIGLGISLVVVASTEAIIANAPVDEAGVAGGLQGIAVQLGGVLGSSVLGSVLAARVSGRIPTGFPVTRQLVEQGIVPNASSPAVAATAHSAFLSGLRLALVVAAAATAAGALCGPWIRSSSGQPSDRSDRAGADRAGADRIVVHM